MVKRESDPPSMASNTAFGGDSYYEDFSFIMPADRDISDIQADLEPERENEALEEQVHTLEAEEAWGELSEELDIDNASYSQAHADGWFYGD